MNQPHRKGADPAINKTLSLPPDYVRRTDPKPMGYESPTAPTIYQPYVYEVAMGVAYSRGADYLLDVGCGLARKSVGWGGTLVGVDCRAQIQQCEKEWGASHPQHWWVSDNLESPSSRRWLTSEVKASKVFVVCADVIEHLVHPERLVHDLLKWLPFIAGLVISTPDRGMLSPATRLGPPANKHHVQEWSHAGLIQFLRSVNPNFKVSLAAHTLASTARNARHNCLMLMLENQ